MARNITDGGKMKLADKITRLIMSNVVTEQKQLLADIRNNGIESTTIALKRGKVKSVKKVRKANNEYVYDIGMQNANKPWYFGNNILIHNSCYFTAYPALKEEIKRGDIEWNKDVVIDLYNNIAGHVTETFPEFLSSRFNVPLNRSTGVVKSSREVVATSGLFIKKKRYAVMVYDKEGVRKDVNGKPGSVKAMGLDLRRSDTPKFVQEFLMELLIDTLTDKGEEHVISKIREFKEKFEAMKPWQKGTPKAVNRLSHYKGLLESTIEKKMKGYDIETALTIPGHVRASFNWNMLRELHGDNHSLRIVDGQRIVVCKLKDTGSNMSSIALPVDELHIPEWFIELPFAEDDMMESIVNKKVDNLLSVLSWDLSRSSKEHAHLENLFDFSVFK